MREPIEFQWKKTTKNDKKKRMRQSRFKNGKESKSATEEEVTAIQKSPARRRSAVPKFASACVRKKQEQPHRFGIEFCDEHTTQEDVKKAKKAALTKEPGTKVERSHEEHVHEEQ